MDSFCTWAELLFVLLASAAVLVSWRYYAKSKSRKGSRETRVAPDARSYSAITVEPSGPLVIGPAEPVLVRSVLPGPMMVGPTHLEALVIAPERPLTIQPPQRGAWDDRGWVVRVENGQRIYEGMYQVAVRSSGQCRRFRGTVVANNKKIVAYLADPPNELRRHPKHPCFQLTKPPWFRLHWHRPARNVDEAILYIERVLDEAINGRRVA